MFRQSRFAALISTLAVMLLVPAQAREVYRWQDDAGVIHLSDTPPLAAQADTLVIPDTPVAPSAATPARTPAVPAPPARPQAPALPASQVLVRTLPPPTVVQSAPQNRSGWWNVLAVPAPRVSDPSLGQAQRQALAERGLDGPRRPVSINSSTHAQRVARSQALALGEQ